MFLIKNLVSLSLSNRSLWWPAPQPLGNISSSLSLSPLYGSGISGCHVCQVIIVLATSDRRHVFCVLLSSHYEPVPLVCVWYYIADQSGTLRHPSLLGDHRDATLVVVTVVVTVTVTVVLPLSVVVPSETERLSSFSPHPCKDVETKDPMQMATWHAARANLSLDPVVKTAVMILCISLPWDALNVSCLLYYSREWTTHT